MGQKINLSELSKALWSSDCTRYPVVRDYTRALNLTAKQCQRLLGKDEVELKEKLDGIVSGNTEYMGFIDEYTLKNSNYRLLNMVVNKPKMDSAYMARLRKMDRESAFELLFSQMSAMEREVINFGTMTSEDTKVHKCIPLGDYTDSYAPLFNAFDGVREYFEPTAEDMADKSL